MPASVVQTYCSRALACSQARTTLFGCFQTTMNIYGQAMSKSQRMLRARSWE